MTRSTGLYDGWMSDPMPALTHISQRIGMGKGGSTGCGQGHRLWLLTEDPGILWTTKEVKGEGNGGIGHERKKGPKRDFGKCRWAAIVPDDAVWTHHAMRGGVGRH